MSPALDSRSRTLRRLAVVAVVTFQAFLALSSQYLFAHIDPQPLRSSRQRWIFNTLILLLMTCFTRSSLSHAGCPQQLPAAILRSEETTPEKPLPRRCRKCNAPKPLRWHHCKACQTCIPKMDHHCFWINNCVSHITFPHFTRFLLYSVAAMSYLQYFLFRCFKVLWDNRHLPHYLGPTAPQLVHLFALGFSNSIALLALSILLSKAVYSLFTNVYMIEGWEIERHEALVERARKSSGYLYGPGGVEIRIQKQEYPYDIGFWGNMVQGMGTANPLAWFWPFSRSPTIESAIEWPVNEFEDATITWPPPDPEKMSLGNALLSRNLPAQIPDFAESSEMEAFRRRQQMDIVRKRQTYGAQSGSDEEKGSDHEAPAIDTGGPWRNPDGERLAGFGVDEDVDRPKEDDRPLSTLIRRKKRP